MATEESKVDTATPITNDIEKPDCGCGPDAVIAAGDKKPDADLIAKLEAVKIFDKDCKEHSFKSVYQTPGITRHLIILIRRFICTNCQEYVRELNWQIPRDKLPAGTAITIISNGSPELILSYLAATGCKYDVFVDPDRNLYKLLELTQTNELGPRPSYTKQSMPATVFVGIAEGLMSGKNLMQGGDGHLSQNGGEFLFVKHGEGEDEKWTCEFAHRMKFSRDHGEIAELVKLLGAEEAHNKEQRSRTWRDTFREISSWRTGGKSGKNQTIIGK